MTIKRNILRYLFIGLTFLGSFSTYPKAIPAVHADEPPEGDIIEISTPEDFQNINNDLTAHYEVINDIDFEGFELIPIALYTDFTGVIEGNNFVFSNIKLLIPSNYGYAYYGGNQELSVALIINNNGIIRNLNFTNIYFSNSNNNTITLSRLDLNYQYDLNFSLLVKNNKLNGIINNISLHASSLSVIISSDSFSNYWEHYFKVNFTISLIVEVNWGIITNSFFNFSGNSNFSINNGYKRITNINFSLVNKNYSLLENNFLSYSGNFFISNKEKTTMFYQHHEEKVISFSYYVSDNFGFIINTHIFSEVYLDFTIKEIRYLSIRKAFIAITSNEDSSIQNSRIINNSRLNYNIDDSGDGNNFSVYHDGFVNKLLGTEVNNVLIENNEKITFDITFRSFSSNSIIISQLGNFTDDSSANHIIVSGNPKYELRGGGILYWVNFYFYSGTRSTDGDANIDFIFLNLSPIVFIDSNDNHFVNSIISDFTFKILEISTIAGSNVFNSNQYIFFANKIANPNSLINGIDQTDYGIWNSDSPNYFLSDSSFFFTLENINQLQNLLELDQNWTFDQVTLDQMPILAFTIIQDFSFTNEQIVIINHSFIISDKISVTMNNISLSTGTYFLFDLGNYEFVLTNSFTINKVLISVKNSIIDGYDNQTFNTTFTPTLLGVSSARLNDITYIPNTPITDPGEHSLTIFGENGYEQIITFTIVLDKTGVTNGVTYTQSVTPSFSGGEATLNGQPYETDTEISDVGHYTLIITGVNGFIDTTSFTIAPITSDLQNGAFLESGYIPNITGEGISLELNGSPYTIGTPITDPGEHSLTIFGENGYEQIITFTIVLDKTGVTNGVTYTQSVTPSFSGGEATLNGQPYEPDTEISDVGHYTLIITGVNGFIDTTSFTIAPVYSDLSKSHLFRSCNAKHSWRRNADLSKRPYCIKY
jgi:hypothetical protein